MSVTGPTVPALERALAILEVLAKSRAGLSAAQIARSLGLPKSSVHYLVQTLDRAGYVHRDGRTRTFRLGLRFRELADRALNGIAFREEAHPFLQRLSQSTRLVVHLGMLEEGSVVVLDKLEPPQPIRVATWVGKRISVHCTALGKAIIAYLPEDHVDEIVARHPLLRHNENTIASLRRLKEELETVRRRGYALDDEEEEIGMRCIGAPVRGAGDVPLAALSVVGRTMDVDAENYEQLARRVMETAAAISSHVTEQWIG
ncbi:MAG: helix-turn-helix domain-containing protein [Luteitalea sp.]|nr:helix-turn-helix domain-containing protein [Luteitalea sp.]